MAKEIERKFLLASDAWRHEVQISRSYRQGYLASNEQSSVRVRIAGEQAWLNIKSRTLGAERDEYEYVIPPADARQILDTLASRPLVEKVRHFVPVGQHTWEIDEFLGENQGLVLAEIELGDANEDFVRPGWLGKEVTDDPRYYNVNLVGHPFSRW